MRLSGQYDPQHYADQLLILREDLRDPILRARGRAWLAVLTEAIEQRLAGTPGAAGLGALAITHWQGALTVWSFRQDAPLDQAVRAALADLFSRLAV